MGKKKVPQKKIKTNSVGMTKPPEVDSKRVQPKRPRSKAETSSSGGFGSTAPEAGLNVAHVPYSKGKKRKKPKPATISTPVFEGGVLKGLRKKRKRQKK